MKFSGARWGFAGYPLIAEVEWFIVLLCDL